MSGGIGDKIIEVAVLIYPQCQISAVHGLTDLFRIANQWSAFPHEDGTGCTIRVTHWLADEDARTINCVSDSMPGHAHRPIYAICPPSVAMPQQIGAMPTAARWLTSQYKGGAVICSVCAGAFVVAQTGLLSGRRVTTHWAFAELLALRHPDIHVGTDFVVIDDGDIITAGAILAWNDLGLLLVGRIMGTSVMLHTGRFMLSEGVREDQRPFQGYPPRLDHGDAAILAAQHFIHANPGIGHSISSLAELSRLTDRTFIRRFKRSTNLNPSAYIRRVRMEKARYALQMSKESISTIAVSLGYNDAYSFSESFRKEVGITPKLFRDKFKVSY